MSQVQDQMSGRSEIERWTRRSGSFLIALAVGLALCGEADAAKKKKKTKKHKAKAPIEKPEPIAWEAVTRDGPGGRICFAASEPTMMFPASYAHGAVYFMVSDWKGGAKNQPSLSVGYALNPQVTPVGTVQSAAGKFPQQRFYVDGKDAFLERPDQERQLITNMRSGKSLRIEAVAADNVQATYEFSLSGFGAAVEAAARACL